MDCPLNVKLSRDVPFMIESIDAAVIIDVGVIELVVCGFGSVTTGCTRSTEPFIHVYGPMLPTWSTMRHLSEKFVMFPLLLCGIIVADAWYEVCAVCPFVKHSARSAPMPPLSMMFDNAMVVLGPKIVVV